MNINNFLLQTLVLFCTMTTTLNCRSPRDYLRPSFVLEGIWVGFFGNFQLVIGALESYEKGICKGISVQFDRNHCYFDKSYGPNWWEYYFEPLTVGSMKDSRILTSPQTVQWMKRAHYYTPKSYAYNLINKYITIKKDILDEVDNFCANNSFDAYNMIGVHYRGTDKTGLRYREAIPVSYEEMFAFMDKEKRNHLNHKFFIATDEQGFVEAVTLRYGDNAVYCQQIRSTTELGVHNMKEIPNYIKGREALIDCLLLSRCNTLIRMSSNLSACSPMFNPKIKVITVNSPDNKMGMIF